MALFQGNQRLLPARGRDFVMYGFGLELWGTQVWRKWVLSGRNHRVAPNEASLVWVLSHNNRYKLSFTAIVALFASVYCLAFVWDDAFANDPMWKRLLIQYGFLAIVGLSFYLVASAFFDRVELSEHCLTIHTLFLPAITVRWEDIKSLSLSSSVNPESIVLFTNGGSKRKISLFMNGLGAFREFVERKLPPEKWWAAADALPRTEEPFRR
jgi:hypothetical protein